MVALLLPLWSLDALRWWCLFLFATPVVCISEIIMTQRGCGTRMRPLTRPFSVQQRGAGGVERPHNPRSDAIRTCFRSAERVTEFVRVLGEECSVTVTHHPAKKELFQKTSLGCTSSRHDGRHLAWGCNVVDSGAHVLGPCCPEAVGCVLKGKRWRRTKKCADEPPRDVRLIRARKLRPRVVLWCLGRGGPQARPQEGFGTEL